MGILEHKINGPLFYQLPTSQSSSVVRVNHIQPIITYLNSPPINVSHSFSFQNETIIITTGINRSIYEGAKNTDKRVYIFDGVPYVIWEGYNVRTMAQDPAQDDFFFHNFGRYEPNEI